MAENTMMLSTGISLTPNWDKNGRIFYTDENGEVVKQTINPYKYLTNSLRAIKSNLGDKLLNIGQERSKSYYAPFEDIKEQYNKGAIDNNQVQRLAEGRLNQEIEEANKYQRGENTRGAIGSLISAASFHPFLNVPWVGTGLGGAAYDLGQGIVEGDNAGDLWNRAKRGFVIGETVGAIPYVGKGLGKTKAGQAIGNATTNLTNNLISKTGTIRPIRAAKQMLNQDIVWGQNPFSNPLRNREVLYDILADDMGNPISFYHSTPNAGFTDFNPGSYFTKDIEYSKGYKNPNEVFNLKNFTGTPDFKISDAVKARRDGFITIYSSKPITEGGFVTPSKMEAMSYLGNGEEVHKAIVPIKDVAWIDSIEGQYAPITHKEYGLSNTPLKFTGKTVKIKGKTYQELDLSKSDYRSVLDGFNNHLSPQARKQLELEKNIGNSKFYIVNDGFNEPIVTWEELIDKKGN